MSKTESQHRDDIVRVGRLMFEKGWVASNDGNISIRLGPNRMLATPAGVSKGMLTPEDLLICDLEGNKLEGHRQPTIFTRWCMRIRPWPRDSPWQGGRSIWEYCRR
jgi:L-fuculose-phosphate aldolase